MRRGGENWASSPRWSDYMKTGDPLALYEEDGSGYVEGAVPDVPQEAPRVARVGFIESVVKELRAEGSGRHGASGEVQSYADVVDRPKGSSKKGAGDWGYSREKNLEWENPQWSSASGWTQVEGDNSSNQRDEDDGFVTYKGKPAIVETEEGVDYWCDVIRHSGVTVLGFDTEWKPEYQRGQDNPIAVIQLCFRNTSDSKEVDHQVVLIHAIQTGVTEKLASILEDPGIVKAGVDLSCDRRKLDTHYGVVLAGEVEINVEYAKRVGNRNRRIGTKTLVASILDLNMRKSKKLSRFNWEKPLTHTAIQYATLDAYVASLLYEKLFDP